MDTTPSTTPAHAAPTAHDHAKLFAFLQILLALAPAVASSFVKNAHSQAILESESQVVQNAVNALAFAAQPPAFKPGE